MSKDRETKNKPKSRSSSVSSEASATGSHAQDQLEADQSTSARAFRNLLRSNTIFQNKLLEKSVDTQRWVENASFQFDETVRYLIAKQKAIMANVGTIHLRNMSMTPFSGKERDSDIGEWLEELERTANALEWTDAKKGNMCEVLLRGAARMTLQTIKSKRTAEIAEATAANAAAAALAPPGNAVPVPGRLTWAELKEQLGTQLTAVGSGRLAQSKFNRRCQRKGEGVSDYAYELLRLNQKGWPLLPIAEREALVLQRLQEGSLPAYRPYLITQHFETLQAALEQAQLLEFALEGSDEEGECLALGVGRPQARPPTPPAGGGRGAEWTQGSSGQQGSSSQQAVGGQQGPQAKGDNYDMGEAKKLMARLEGLMVAKLEGQTQRGRSETRKDAGERSGTCRICGKSGHWMRECPERAGGRGRGKGAMSGGARGQGGSFRGRQVPERRVRFEERIRLCWGCGESGHLSNSPLCPMNQEGRGRMNGRGGGTGQTQGPNYGGQGYGAWYGSTSYPPPPAPGYPQYPVTPLPYYQHPPLPVTGPEGPGTEWQLHAMSETKGAAEQKPESPAAMALPATKQPEESEANGEKEVNPPSALEVAGSDAWQEGDLSAIRPVVQMNRWIDVCDSRSTPGGRKQGAVNGAGKAGMKSGRNPARSGTPIREAQGEGGALVVEREAQPQTQRHSAMGRKSQHQRDAGLTPSRKPCPKPSLPTLSRTLWLMMMGLGWLVVGIDADEMESKWQRPNPLLCGEMGSSVWRVPSEMPCFIQPSTGKPRNQSLQLLWLNQEVYRSVGFICTRTLTKLHQLPFVFGVNAVQKVEVITQEVSHAECRSYIETNQCMYGKLHVNPDYPSLSHTENQLDYTWPPWWECCRWRVTSTAGTCAVQNVTVSKRHQDQAPASPVIDLRGCLYSDGYCRLSQGRMALWKVNLTEQCGFVKGKKLDGLRLGTNWMSKGEQLALTFTKSQEIETQCHGNATKTDQGVVVVEGVQGGGPDGGGGLEAAVRRVRPPALPHREQPHQRRRRQGRHRSHRRRLQRDAGEETEAVVVDSFVAARLEAVVGHIEAAIRSAFLVTARAVCQLQRSHFMSLRSQLRMEPTAILRQLLGRTDLVAVPGSNVVGIRPCMELNDSTFHIGGGPGCAVNGYVRIEFTVGNVTHWGWMDVKTNVIQSRRTKVSCTAESRQLIELRNQTFWLSTDGTQSPLNGSHIPVLPTHLGLSFSLPRDGFIVHGFLSHSLGTQIPSFDSNVWAGARKASDALEKLLRAEDQSRPGKGGKGGQPGWGFGWSLLMGTGASWLYLYVVAVCVAVTLVAAHRACRGSRMERYWSQRMPNAGQAWSAGRERARRTWAGRRSWRCWASRPGTDSPTPARGTTPTPPDADTIPPAPPARSAASPIRGESVPWELEAFRHPFTEGRNEEAEGEYVRMSELEPPEEVGRGGLERVEEEDGEAGEGRGQRRVGQAGRLQRPLPLPYYRRPPSPWLSVGPSIRQSRLAPQPADMLSSKDRLRQTGGNGSGGSAFFAPIAPAPQSPEVETVQNVTSSGTLTGPLVVVKLPVEGRETVCLVDSGATCNVVAVGALGQLGFNGGNVIPEEGTLQNICGVTRKVGRVFAKVRLGTEEIEVCFKVVDILNRPYTCILGTSLWSRCGGLSIDWPTQQLRLARLPGLRWPVYAIGNRQCGRWPGPEWIPSPVLTQSLLTEAQDVYMEMNRLKEVGWGPRECIVWVKIGETWCRALIDGGCNGSAISTRVSHLYRYAMEGPGVNLDGGQPHELVDRRTVIGMVDTTSWVGRELGEAPLPASNGEGPSKSIPVSFAVVDFGPASESFAVMLGTDFLCNFSTTTWDFDNEEVKLDDLRLPMLARQGEGAVEQSGQGRCAVTTPGNINCEAFHWDERNGLGHDTVADADAQRMEGPNTHLSAHGTLPASDGISIHFWSSGRDEWDELWSQVDMHECGQPWGLRCREELLEDRDSPWQRARRGERVGRGQEEPRFQRIVRRSRDEAPAGNQRLGAGQDQSGDRGAGSSRRAGPGTVDESSMSGAWGGASREGEEPTREEKVRRVREENEWRMDAFELAKERYERGEAGDDEEICEVCEGNDVLNAEAEIRGGICQHARQRRERERRDAYAKAEEDLMRNLQRIPSPTPEMRQHMRNREATNQQRRTRYQQRYTRRHPPRGTDSMTRQHTEGDGLHETVYGPLRRVPQQGEAPMNKPPQSVLARNYYHMYRDVVVPFGPVAPEGWNLGPWQEPLEGGQGHGLPQGQQQEEGMRPPRPETRRGLQGQSGGWGHQTSEESSRRQGETQRERQQHTQTPTMVRREQHASSVSQAYSADTHTKAPSTKETDKDQGSSQGHYSNVRQSSFLPLRQGDQSTRDSGSESEGQGSDKGEPSVSTISLNMFWDDQLETETWRHQPQMGVDKEDMGTPNGGLIKDDQPLGRSLRSFQQKSQIKSQESEEGEAMIQAAGTETKGEGPGHATVIKIQVGKIDVVALADSGATVSCISVAFAETLERKPGIVMEVDQDLGHVTVFGGTIAIQRRVRVPVTVAGVTEQVEFVVLPNGACKYRIVLGSNAMVKFGPLTLDYERKSVAVGGRVVGGREMELVECFMLHVAMEAVPIPVRVAAATKITANSGQILRCYLGHPESKHEVLPCSIGPIVMVEGHAPRLEEVALMMPRLICDVKEQRVEIQVLNPNPYPVQLYQHMLMGYAEACKILYHPDEEGSKIACLRLPEEAIHAITEVEPATKEEFLARFKWEGAVGSAEQKAEFEELLWTHKEAFACHNYDLGSFDLMRFKIDVGGHPPIATRPRRLPEAMKPVVKKEIEEMLEKGVIEHAVSPWSSNLVVVKKADGVSWRVCTDFRRLNSVTRKDKYPLPRADEMVDCLGNAQWVSSIDLQQAYWQVLLAEETKPLTAFTCCYGTYQYRKAPFGVANMPSWFQRLMEFCLSGLQWQCVLCYLDDLLVYSPSWSQHLVDVAKILDRLQSFKLKAKPSKCAWLRKEIKFLGYIVSAAGARPSEDKLEAIRNLQSPKTVKELQAALGLCNYYRKWLAGYSAVAAPLFTLIRKGVEFKWTAQHESVYRALIQKLQEAPILAIYDPAKRCYISCDASGLALGAVLSQVHDGEERPVGYYSRACSKAEKNYSNIERECLAIVWAVKECKPYVFGQAFTVYSDHKPLKALVSTNTESPRLQKWALELQGYDMTIVYKPGKDHGNADAFSRVPPVGGFKEDVGEVLALVEDDERGYLLLDKRLRVEQRRDPWLSQILAFLEEGRLPEDETVGKRICKASEDYVIGLAGCLYRKQPNPGASERPLAVPTVLMGEILVTYHEELGAHLAWGRTLSRLRRAFHWPAMAADCRRHCESCMVCSQTKTLTYTPKAPCVPLALVGRFDRLIIDCVGPLEETEQGNTQIIVMMDSCTKWVEAVAVKDIKAPTVARVLLDAWICRFGAPRELLSDGASSFTSKIVEELNSIFNIIKVTSTAYRPQTQGALERWNRTAGEMLKAYCLGQGERWDQFLGLSLLAYRTSTHAATGETPGFLVTGHDMAFPIQAMLIPRPKQWVEIPDYRANLVVAIQDANRIAQEHAQREQDQSKRREDLKIAGPAMVVGDRVWLQFPKTAAPQGRGNRKLWLSRKGPYRIVAEKFPNMELVPITKPRAKGRWVHINRLVPCVAGTSAIITEFSDTEEESEHEDGLGKSPELQFPPDMKVKEPVQLQVEKKKKGKAKSTWEREPHNLRPRTNR